MMAEVMDTLRDIHLKGIGLEYGKLTLFFESGVMATVEPESITSTRGKDACYTGDIVVTLGEYDEEE